MSGAYFVDGKKQLLKNLRKIPLETITYFSLILFMQSINLNFEYFFRKKQVY